MSDVSPPPKLNTSVVKSLLTMLRLTDTAWRMVALIKTVKLMMGVPVVVRGSVTTAWYLVALSTARKSGGTVDK